jgi:hypothetical protein
MATTSETLEKAQQLAMECRIQAGRMISDYRRGSIVRLRRGKAAAGRCARLAADLAATAFQAADLLDAELREARNRADC